MSNSTIWIVGVSLRHPKDPRPTFWMPEGVYATEAEAVEACSPGEFVVECAIGARIPADAKDSLCCYFPADGGTREQADRVRAEMRGEA